MNFRLKKKSSLWLGFLAVLLILTGCARQETDGPEIDRIIGVKIYEWEGDLRPLFEQWQALGINTVFASVSLNANQEFRALSAEYDITRFIIVPIFYDPEALEKNPDLYAITDGGEKAVDDWVRFVCPSREDFRQRKIELIKKYIRNYDPDGLSIDFIRHFVFWEKIFPERTLSSISNTCFDKSCLEQYEADTGISIPDNLTSPLQASRWIKENHLQSWVSWKCDLITSMVQSITTEAKRVKSDILFNVHAVPWRQIDFDGAAKIIAGQDFFHISEHTDYLSPMTYSHMLKRQPSWVHDVVLDVDKFSKCQVLPSIQVRQAYLNDVLSVSEFRENLEAALEPPSSGVVLWSWEALEGDKQKKDVLLQTLQKR